MSSSASAASENRRSPPVLFMVRPRLAASRGDLLEGLAGVREDGIAPGVGLPSSHSDIDVSGIDLKPITRRPTRSAAIIVLPEPMNGSSTMSPRREQSRIASATRATGLTVGCIARSSIRPARNVLTPA